MSDRPQLVLASGSRARRDMMTAAGLTFEVLPAADVDEAVIRDRMLAASPPAAAPDIALALAEAKAAEVARRRARALVVGADQVLVQGGRLYEKPRDLAEARSQLMSLRARAHRLVSAVVLHDAGGRSWSSVAVAELVMRPFSEAFLDAYLAKAGARVTESVGAYQLEGLGLQLFDRIEGDYFTILGMPLLPLLAELRSRGVIPA